MTTMGLLRPKRAVVNPAPNAGRHRALGSVMILACSADCVSERKFIAPRETMRGRYFDHILTRMTLALMLVAPLDAFAQDTNTGGRVGWHNSPLPGPLFPW